MVMEKIFADIGWLNATRRRTERPSEIKSSALLCNFFMHALSLSKIVCTMGQGPGGACK